jgi:predicted Zn-dependent protease
MLILYENQSEEAKAIKEAIEKTLKIKARIEQKDLTFLFEPIPKFNGFWHSSDKIARRLSEKEKTIMVLTSKDIYFEDNSKEDDFCFAYTVPSTRRADTVISTARLTGKDDSSREKRTIPKELYFQRLVAMAIHEICHDIVRGSHLKETIWTNSQTEYSLNTGLHCPNNNCVFYQVAGVRTPTPLEGHILVGGEKKFDTGLDDLIKRLNPEYFCDDCKKTIKVGKKYL